MELLSCTLKGLPQMETTEKTLLYFDTFSRTLFCLLILSDLVRAIIDKANLAL